MTPSSEELISIPIPRRLLADVYGFVAQHEKGSQVPTASDETEPGEPDEALIQRMYTESQPKHKELMKLFAQSPDQWLYTSEIAQAMRLPHGSTSVAGMLGAFGRRAKHRYSGAKPWKSEWDPAKSEARHKMSANVAHIIKLL